MENPQHAGDNEEIGVEEDDVIQPETRQQPMIPITQIADALAGAFHVLADKLPDQKPKFRPFDPAKHSAIAWINLHSRKMTNIVIQPDELADHLALAMEGFAGQWFSAISDGFLTWENFETQFRNKFCKPVTPCAAIHRALTAKPEEGDIGKLVTEQTVQIRAALAGKSLEEITTCIAGVVAANHSFKLQEWVYTHSNFSEVELMQQIEVQKASKQLRAGPNGQKGPFSSSRPVKRPFDSQGSQQPAAKRGRFQNFSRGTNKPSTNNEQQKPQQQQQQQKCRRHPNGNHTWAECRSNWANQPQRGGFSAARGGRSQSRGSQQGQQQRQGPPEKKVAQTATAPVDVLNNAVLKEEFRQEPQNLRAAQGETALLECGPPRGHPEPVVIWKRNGHVIDFENNKRLRLVDGANLAIQDVRHSDDGKYQCVAKNTVGVRESAIALLRVHVKPYIVKEPEDAVSLVGGSVIFECSVQGDPVPDVMWKRTAGGGPMPLARARILDDKSLKLEAVIAEDEGEYSCEADNGVGTVSASATLTVHSPPVILVKPQDQLVEVADDAVFTCGIDGNPRPSIFWSIEGNRTLLYPGETMGKFHATITPDGQAVLTVQDVTRNDSGVVVICSAVNQAGSDTWRARLSVTSPEENPPPVILLGPANQTLPLKSVAAMNCRASGVPQPVITWYKDGIPVLSSLRINISESGTLQINDLVKTDSGEYTCVASSRSGKATWSAHLRLESPTNPNIAFYRAPEASTFPGPPTRPVLVNRTHNSVTISWSRNNKIGSSSLIGYQIEIFTRLPNQEVSEPPTTPGWSIAVRRVPGPAYTITNLRPGATYVFLVRAENSHGLSPPSPRSEPVSLAPPQDRAEGDEDPDMKEARAALLSGHVVELAHIQPLSSTSIKIVWKILNGEYVEGFYIYSRGLDGSSRATNMLTMLHDGEAPGFIVTGLAKFTRYQFFLVPFYKTLDGRPSNSRTARTLEDIPSEPPNGLEAVLLNSSAVYLKWKAPPQAAHNGILRTYQVIVRGGDPNNGTLLSNVTVNAGTPSLLLTNLSSGVVYTVEVAAATRAGIGPYTIPAILRLDPASRQVYRDQHHRQPIGKKPGIGPGPNDFLTETWFMALLGSMVAVMLLLFTAMMLVRRRQILTKKSSLPDSRSNGGILATPLSLKAAVGLPHPMSAALVPHPHDSTLWIEPGRGPIWAGEANRIADLLEPADYAEVDPVCQSFGKGDGSVSPAPYATTTLVPKYSGGSTASTRQLLHSSNSRIPQGWLQICPQKDKDEDMSYSPKTPLYSSNIYSDTYFSDYNPPKSGCNVSAKPSSIVMSSCGRKALSELGSRHDDGGLCPTLKRPPAGYPPAPSYQPPAGFHPPRATAGWRMTPNPVHTLSTFTPAPAHHHNQYQPLYHNSSRSEPSS